MAISPAASSSFQTHVQMTNDKKKPKPQSQQKYPQLFRPRTHTNHLFAVYARHIPAVPPILQKNYA